MVAARWRRSQAMRSQLAFPRRRGPTRRYYTTTILRFYYSTILYYTLYYTPHAGEELPADAALAVYAPLFLPVGVTVLSTAAAWARGHGRPRV